MEKRISPVFCDSLTPCSWLLCCLKELNKEEGTAYLSMGRDEGPQVFLLPSLREESSGKVEMLWHQRGDWHTGTSQGDGCLVKKGDQSEVCNVLQNGTKDLQRKLQDGTGPSQCCSGLHVTSCSWCITHSFCVMTFKLLCSSNFYFFLIMMLLGRIKS